LSKEISELYLGSKMRYVSKESIHRMFSYCHVKKCTCIGADGVIHWKICVGDSG